MKNYRGLVPVILVVLLAVSWYQMISSAAKVEKQYQEYLTQARQYASKGITKYAIENYRNALAVKAEMDVYAEVAQYYKSQKMEKEQLAWCEDFFEKYPTQVKAYDCLIEAYLAQKDYASCWDILYTAQKRNISSAYIDQIRSSLEYVYQMDYDTYDDVGIYSNHYCPVFSKEAWGYIDCYGDLCIACKYKAVGYYTQSGLSSVVTPKEEVFFIDSAGDKVLVSDEKFSAFGLMIDDMFTAEKLNGKYVYLSKNFEILLEEYDEASAMNGGIAAVRVNEDWQIIDKNGNRTTQDIYRNIKLDEKNIAYRNERLFVQDSDGKYKLVDSTGKQIGAEKYEDAKIFSDNTYAAVKKNGRWGYIDKEGNMVIQPVFEDARSFANGLAAVKTDGKWGFIDAGGEMKIAAQFFDAKDFNDRGSCFVNTGSKWQLLKLYRLNR